MEAGTIPLVQTLFCSDSYQNCKWLCWHSWVCLMMAWNPGVQTVHRKNLYFPGIVLLATGPTWWDLVIVSIVRTPFLSAFTNTSASLQFVIWAIKQCFSESGKTNKSTFTLFVSTSPSPVIKSIIKAQFRVGFSGWIRSFIIWQPSPGASLTLCLLNISSSRTRENTYQWDKIK